MFDYEAWAPDQATMQAALDALAMKVNSGQINGNTFAVDNYGTKYAQSGTITVAGPGGVQMTIPNMVAQAGWYCNIRWMGANPLSVPANLINRGITITAPQPVPLYRVWA